MEGVLAPTNLLSVVATPSAVIMYPGSALSGSNMLATCTQADKRCCWFASQIILLTPCTSAGRLGLRMQAKGKRPAERMQHPIGSELCGGTVVGARRSMPHLQADLPLALDLGHERVAVLGLEHARLVHLPFLVHQIVNPPLGMRGMRLNRRPAVKEPSASPGFSPSIARWYQHCM